MQTLTVKVPEEKLQAARIIFSALGIKEKLTAKEQAKKEMKEIFIEVAKIEKGEIVGKPIEEVLKNV